MKRPIFTLINFLNGVSERLSLNTRAFSITITLFILFSGNLIAQPWDCNVNISCLGGVQITLDENCQEIIQPDMVMDGHEYPNEAYDVFARIVGGPALPELNYGLDGNGDTIKRVQVNKDHINKFLEVKIKLRGCGISCWSTVKIEDKLAPEVVTAPCPEILTSFTGHIDIDDPVYDRSSDVVGCPVTPAVGVRFEARNFALDVNGIVDITLTNPNLRLALYGGPFNPASPCTNLLLTDFSSFSSNLLAGVDYTLVVSSLTNAVPPGGTDYFVAIRNRSGLIKTSVDAVPCIFDCNEESVYLNQTSANATHQPTFDDACYDDLTLNKIDEVIIQSCSDTFNSIIKRTWTATDGSGNVSDSIVQFFYFTRPVLADVICPADTSLNCTDKFSKLPNGAPTPDVSGWPQNIACKNMQIYYEDIIFPLCGAGIKVNRRWLIIDWCTGEDRECSQIIKVEDKINPSVVCAHDITEPDYELLALVPVSSESCTANWPVLPPSAVDCSDVTWDVAFKKANNSGHFDPLAPFVKIQGTTIVQGTRPAYAPSISASERPYTIRGLELGRYRIQYTVIDECGNSSSCVQEIEVVDNTPPTAICGEHTVVSIDDSGWGELFATSLDDHSIDNCGPIVKYEVRRKTTHCPGHESDLQFGPKVSFCCSDITSPESYVDVILRVYDAAGNWNQCEARVRVQNKRPPLLTCPGDRTLTCGDPRIAAWASGSDDFDEVFFGRPTVSGVCATNGISSRIVSNNLDTKCNAGTVVREWYLTANPNVYCRQTLTVTSPPFSNSDVIWPSDTILATCDLSKVTPDALNSRPKVIDQGCRDIAITYSDQYFEFEDVCVKILRTWKVADWCNFNKGTYLLERTQVIKLTGSGGAVFADCNDKTFKGDEGSCSKELTLNANASDECTAVDKLNISWSVDIDNDGTIDWSGLGASFTRTFPAGKHRVTFTAINRCRTETSCSYTVTITGTKKPTPVCYRELATVIDSDGKAEIWASDFNLKSQNNCGVDGDLYYAFNAEGTELSKSFTCADIPNGQAARIPLKMYAIDQNGSYDFCEVILVLQDSPLTNACADNADLLPSISGIITTETNEGVEGAEVAMQNLTQSTERKFTTQGNGEYKFSGVNVFDFKSIFVNDDVEHLNGVSTLDVVMIQRHVLGLQKLDSPYKLLAADVNNSKNITSSDMSALRKLILGLDDHFENNTSWKFIPTHYQFADPEYPYDYSASIAVDSIYEDMNDANFIAVKVGDVNNSAKVNARSNSIETRGSNALFVMDDKTFEAGKLFRLEIKAGDVMKIMGTQFTLGFDADQLEFSTMHSGLLPVKSYNANLKEVAGGRISFSIDVAEGVQLNSGDVLFTIDFRTKGNGHTGMIKMLQDGLSPEVYEMDATVRHLDLQVRNGHTTEAQTILYQNQPNPFKDYTTLSFEMAEAGQGVIKIMDVTGKLVFRFEDAFNKGYNSINISNNQLSGTGVYYYQLETSNFSATRKMILIE